MLNQIIVSSIRTTYQNTIRQIKIKDVSFSMVLVVYDFVLIFVVVMLLMLAQKQLYFWPFRHIQLDILLIVAALAAFNVSVVCLLISTVFNQYAVTFAFILYGLFITLNMVFQIIDCFIFKSVW